MHGVRRCPGEGRISPGTPLLLDCLAAPREAGAANEDALNAYSLSSDRALAVSVFIPFPELK